MKTKVHHGQQLTRVQWLWRQIFLNTATPGGRVFLWALAVAGVTGMVTLDIPVYFVFCTLLGLYLAVWLFAQMARRNLQVEGHLPARAIAGIPVTCEFSVRNQSALPAWDVGLRIFYLPRPVRQTDEDSAVPRIDPGQRVRIPITLLALRRGLYPLPPARAFTTFPFNLMRTGRHLRETGSLLVVPQFHPLEQLRLAVAPRHQPGGIALTSNVGESPEYIGNRDYRPGDPLRKLDFRSWARLARPVTREFMEEYYCRVALVCDTHVGRRRFGPRGEPALEAAISLAAAVADALGRGEYIIDIFAAGPELYVLRTGRQTSELDSILEILASVEPCRDNPFERITPALADELERISSVLFIFLDWDELRRRLVRLARDHGCKVKVVIVRDGPTTLPIADEAAQLDDLQVLTPEAIAEGQVRSL